MSYGKKKALLPGEQRLHAIRAFGSVV